MNTTTRTRTIRTRSARTRRSLVVLAAVLASAIALAAPAAAQPGGGFDEVLPVPPPDPDPDVALQGFPHCAPARVSYTVAVLGGPDDRPHTVRVDWSDQDSGDAGSAIGAEGTIPTGEGTFDLIAVVTYPQVTTLDDQVLAAVSISSAPTTVTVTCESGGDGGGGNGSDGGDGGGGGNGGADPDPQIDPDVRSATPNFTG